MHASIARCLASASARRSAYVCAANVYVSEGRNKELLALLKAAAGSSCVHVFSDTTYNRTGFTLASQDAARLHDAVIRLSAAALKRLDLREHTATHPRLGVVDHVSVHALSDPADTFSLTRDAEAEAGASRLAQRLGATLCGPPTLLPVYFYGAASPSLTPLDGVRRSLGYFGARSEGGQMPPPDLGPPPRPESGLVCVGALPWVTNFNLALVWADAAVTGRLDELLVCAQRVASAVSQRRGGPVGCQSLALAHDGGAVEVACNLLSPLAPAPAEVRRLVAAAAQAEGLRIAADYCTGLAPDAVFVAALQADEVALHDTATEG